MTQSVIVSAVRTPFGKFLGSLSGKTAVELGGLAIQAAMERAGVEKEAVDGVYMGTVLQAGQGQIPSRQAARLAGLPWETPSLTINKVCASGMRAITLSDALIRAGDMTVAVAGGMESMSNAPYALTGAREGYRMGHGQLLDLMLVDGLTCAFHNKHMAIHGSDAARKYGVTREDQDAFALRSHERAIAAIDGGAFADEIVPVSVRIGKEDKVVSSDEAPRRDTSLEKLARLKPVFQDDGSVTAGNAPGVNDGASAVVVMDEEYAIQCGYKPLARILGYAEVGTEAAMLATTPALATQKLLAKTGRRLEDVDQIEVNEAFAAVPLITAKILDCDLAKINMSGGAVALGHPIGASGARIVTTLIHQLRRRGGGLGIAAICSGAAQGDAILLEVLGDS
ncbi:acetyl-CoA C-acetyltransferase [Alicyclobacillus fastidiosus]|uniref:acetyl-CoA C-acetyltransferase n=1 Tax=Alicyclobacillus fastidiosus TaxID=392011 RepID=A0ABY6ZPH9_9BACL|nr:acetyl-CoA C-acetyltransferase [Alicyclobacillus fastidiosus]WAH44762.1 acetyl-CoA C-acetyltransferase [Alicyclobacillus fastidiosus]GMA63582.1 acetyl-CoA acetyltransferase [Alicyclobacillus fastidiosus]